MKVSRDWLQKYFDAPLPDAQTIADAYTFHAFEIEEMQDPRQGDDASDMLDVKVLPNRAADCLSHRGLARELSAILDIPLTSDPLHDSVQGETLYRKYKVSPCTVLRVEIEDPKKCLRYMGALVKGVKVGPSPAWLREALLAVGQRSINNIVDATNYVMLNIGQPLHAFDAASLDGARDKKLVIKVRNAREGEKITTLTGDEYELASNIQLITDANADTPIALAGIKGGRAAELTDDTTDIIVESANFDGTTVRRGAQALKLFTDASLRFQNRPSPELAAYGMRDVLALITEIAGGEVADIADEYPAPASTPAPVSTTPARINGLLGSDFSQAEVENVFKRLALPYMVIDDRFTVTPPFERTDLTIPEDLAEEVGRIIGYDNIASQELSAGESTPDQARYRGIERMKDQLVEQGFTEVSTQSFTKVGDIYLANPLDKAKSALRTSLEQNLQDALTRAKLNASLVLVPNQKPKLFEVGTVFPKEGERLELRMSESAPGAGWEKFGTVDDLEVGKLERFGAGYEPVRYELGTYKPFPIYPFIVRDIALWVPAGTDDGHTMSIIREQAGELLIRLDQFDRFEREGKVSLAFRLVFQSSERTLTDEEANGVMAQISKALIEARYEVR